MSEDERKPLEEFDGKLRHLRASNPSPMTGPGTSTYLLGRGEVTVIDPGPAEAPHLDAILAALNEGERITAILVTHPHLDHSALAPALARLTGAPTYGFGAAGSKRRPAMQALAEAGPGAGEGVDLGFTPDRIINDGEVLRLGNERIEVVHTPGHMAEHAAFGWRGNLFCGDHVMAWAPSLVSPPDGDMAAYLASLAQVAKMPWQRLIPAHGDWIEAPQTRIAELIAHRRAREAAILEALRRGPRKIEEILPLVYGEITPVLWPAAARNILAHLVDLLERQWIKADPWPSETAIFSLR